MCVAAEKVNANFDRISGYKTVLKNKQWQHWASLFHHYSHWITSSFKKKHNGSLDLYVVENNYKPYYKALIGMIWFKYLECQRQRRIHSGTQWNHDVPHHLGNAVKQKEKWRGLPAAVRSGQLTHLTHTALCVLTHNAVCKNTQGFTHTSEQGTTLCVGVREECQINSGFKTPTEVI